MKLNFKTEARSQKPEVRSWPGGDCSHRAPRVSRPNNLQPSQRGIALVITLILLAVTLVMALAFLAISQRESGSVTTAGETAAARLAADAALASAEAQAMAGILSTTNPYNFGLLVSTNYINPAGFDPVNANPFNNVNYDHDTAGNRLTPNEFLQNLANLYYSPRPPVFVPTPPDNYVNPASYDFRFYLDLNRNGKFDTNGIVGDFAPNASGQIMFDGTTSFQVGDPEWIGVLAHPDQPYGPNNPFIARYAYIALPVGNSLDLNAIHNQTETRTVNLATGSLPPGTGDGFFRNQGVGSWEINLAAFLADLNTNQWGQVVGSYPNFPIGSANWYQYNQANPPPSAPANVGNAFDDARALLTYRYNNNYNSLATVRNLYGVNGATVFQNDGIDGYSDGPLQTTLDTNEDFFVNNDNPALPWAGADNTNHFFTPSDLFDPTKSSPAFTNRLALANGNGAAIPSTYNRYTFYRLLSQLGTDTTPESGKLNLNYRNVTNGVIVPGMETNFYPWTALEFFTNAADRMLRTYTAQWLEADSNRFVATFNVTNSFGITDIPVWVSNRFVYSSAVNRLLQLAANIYDATVSNKTNGSPDYPDVFRPLFSKDLTGDVFISGYTGLTSASGPNTVSGTADLQLSQPVDIATISALSNPILSPNLNIYGVPWIIGAKKGFPNFNEFSMEQNLTVTRRLQVTRPATNTATSVNLAAFATNQMYTMSLSNSLGVELWNSYRSNYPGTIQIVMNGNASLNITNDDKGQRLFLMQPQPPSQPLSFSTSQILWPGTLPSSAGNPNPNSFVVVTFNGPALTNAVYRSPFATGTLLGNPAISAPGFVYTNNLVTGANPFEATSSDGNGFYLPQFGVLVTNRLQVFMLDGNHVIDYVHFAGPDSVFNVNANLAEKDAPGTPGFETGVWDTNYPPGSSAPGGPTYGILNQIAISKSGAPPREDGSWQSDPEAIGTIPQQQAFFQAFFLPGNRTTKPVADTNLQLSVQAPYSPTRNIAQYVTWQANDPLVHYLTSDIDEPVAGSSSLLEPGVTSSKGSENIAIPLTSLNLGRLNDSYRPWGGNPKLAAEGQTLQFDTNAYNTTLKDPVGGLAGSSDNWDFPTNKLPATGWLGRVHRGTPWQTVYLKSSPINTLTWATWTGDTLLAGNQNFDAANSMPVNDHLLFDLFTTAFNDNATRGQLSVNVAAGNPDPAAGLAAWSALFSGVVVPTSLTNTYRVIQPAGTYDATLPLTNQPPLAQIVAAINSTRAGTNADGLSGAFEHAGDILRTPQLTEQSPFLAGLNATNQISDEMYEWLPQQVMSLLRAGGAPRYVIYSYGQTLKPAPNGIETGGGKFFGMVTNYQVVAETATRAVVRFDSTLTNILGTNSVINNHAVIESYNILPPD